MYDKGRVKQPKKKITLEWILSKVTEYEIYSHYLGQFKVGAIYNSPFRKDKNPSFGVYYSKKANRLLFKDHGTGECGGIIKFVSLITGITDYNSILENIVEHLHITKDTKLDSTKEYKPTGETVIGIVRQPWTFADMGYWSMFHIGQKTLEKFNVNSIKYYLCNGIVKGIYKDTNPMYAYKVNNNFKIYRPLGDKYTKWRNNLTQDDIQGYQQLPKKGDILIITKSLKDVMCLYEMGIPAISPSSESTWIPDATLEALKKRFKRILVCFDRDASGCKNSIKIWNKYHIKPFFINKRFKAKDISDAIKQNSFEKIKTWLLKEINNERNN